MIDIKFRPYISCEAVIWHDGVFMTRLTPSDDVEKYDRCLRVKDLHRDAGVKVETLVKQPDTK